MIDPARSGEPGGMGRSADRPERRGGGPRVAARSARGQPQQPRAAEPAQLLRGDHRAPRPRRGRAGSRSAGQRLVQHARRGSSPVQRDDEGVAELASYAAWAARSAVCAARPPRCGSAVVRLAGQRLGEITGVRSYAASSAAASSASTVGYGRWAATRRAQRWLPQQARSAASAATDEAWLSRHSPSGGVSLDSGGLRVGGRPGTPGRRHRAG